MEIVNNIISIRFIRKPCLIHGNMVKLLNTEAEALPVSLLSGENVSLLYSLHLVGGTDYLARKVMCNRKQRENMSMNSIPSGYWGKIYLLDTGVKYTFWILGVKYTFWILG